MASFNFTERALKSSDKEGVHASARPTKPSIPTDEENDDENAEEEQFDAWMKSHRQPLSSVLRTLSSQGLARHYGIISQTILYPSDDIHSNGTERSSQSSIHRMENGLWKFQDR